MKKCYVFVFSVQRKATDLSRLCNDESGGGRQVLPGLEWGTLVLLWRELLQSERCGFSQEEEEEELAICRQV